MYHLTSTLRFFYLFFLMRTQPCCRATLDLCRATDIQDCDGVGACPGWWGPAAGIWWMGTWRRGVVGSWSQSSGWASRPRALAPGPQPDSYLEIKIHALTIHPPFEQLHSYSKDIQDKKLQPSLNVCLPHLHNPPGAQAGLKIGWKTEPHHFPPQTALNITARLLHLSYQLPRKGPGGKALT